MNNPGLDVVEQIPSAAEYIALRVAAGLSTKSAEASERGLPASLFAVCIRDGDRLIGMGRVAGDGGLNFEVVDIAVHPDYQRQGLGSKIMAAITDWLDANAPPSAYVSLMADQGAEGLYQRYGFEFTAPATVGMARRMK